MVVGVARTKSADHTSMHGIYEIIDDAANDMQDVFKKMCRMYDDLESRLVKIRAGLAGLSEQLYGEHQAEIKMTLAEDERGPDHGCQRRLEMLVPLHG